MIIGTDYLQIAIVLAVNTRKNKIINKEEKIDEKQEVKIEYQQPMSFQMVPQTVEIKLPETKQETKR